MIMNISIALGMLIALSITGNLLFSAATYDETIGRCRNDHQCYLFALPGCAEQQPTAHNQFLHVYKNGIMEYKKDKGFIISFKWVIQIGHSADGFSSLRICTVVVIPFTKYFRMHYVTKLFFSHIDSFIKIG